MCPTIARMARDIGSYFDRLTRKGRGGRRLDADGARADRGRRRGTDGDRSAAERAQGGRSGGLADVLKDMLGKGRATAGDTAKRARDEIQRRRAPRPTSSRTVGGDRRRSLPPEGVVTVEYSPRMDGDPDPGEVVWTWVPFEEDPEQGKDRPVVVIGRRGRRLVGVPLTTKSNDREAQISIGTGDWDPKRRQSYARIWRMLDIDEDRTRREGAVLQRKRFDAVVAAVDEYYDVRQLSAEPDDDY